METHHSGILLSAESTDWLSFHAELLFPVQLLTTLGTGTLQRQSGRLPIHAGI